MVRTANPTKAKGKKEPGQRLRRCPVRCNHSPNSKVESSAATADQANHRGACQDHQAGRLGNDLCNREIVVKVGAAGAGVAAEAGKSCCVVVNVSRIGRDVRRGESVRCTGSEAVDSEI